MKYLPLCLAVFFSPFQFAQACEFDLEENLSVLDARYSSVVDSVARELKKTKRYDFVSRQAFQKAKRTLFFTYSQPNSFDPGYLETTIVEFKAGHAPRSLFQRKIELDSKLDESNIQLKRILEELPGCPLVESGNLDSAPLTIVAK